MTRAVELLCKIQTNAFHRYDADMEHASVFLDPKLAMANHSCIPNALVHFVGRTAILTAERSIEAGDQVFISYTDYTYPLAKRREALSSYGFECCCHRCSDDLNVYQVCAAYPPPNTDASLVAPDVLSKLGSHPAVIERATRLLARTASKAAVKAVESRVSADESPSARRRMLLDQLRDCVELLAAGLWAVTPLPQVLTELSINYAERGDSASALALACFVATTCDPYRYTALSHPSRVRNLLVVAKLLANTAEVAAAASSQAIEPVETRRGLNERFRELFRDLDQVSLCQTLLTMVLQSAPNGRGAAWEPAMTARDMLRDVEQLPGRDQKLSIIAAWTEDPASDRSRILFEHAVRRPVNALAGLGRELLLVDLEADD